MSAPVAMAVPKELWRMVDYLLNRGSASTGLQSPVIPEKCTSRIEKGEKIDSEFVSVFMNMVGEGGACEA